MLHNIIKLKIYSKVSNGWYKDIEEAKESILLERKVNKDIVLTEKNGFRQILEKLNIKLTWENALSVWFR